MSKLRTFLKLVTTPSKLIRPMVSNGMLKWLPDKMFINIVYKSVFGRKPDLDNPQSYTEKLQWLKLYYRRPEFTMMVDKYKVRDYISETIGNDYLIPLIGVWSSVDDIDYQKLPKSFVLKCNHDQGSVVICKDKSHFDFESAKKKLRFKLRKNHYWRIREYPYKNIKPCIIGEKYMQDESGADQLTDYKVLCFNGEPKLIEVHCGRFNGKHTQDFYDIHWNKTTFGQPSMPPSKSTMERPVFLDEMITLSRQLSAGLPHIRVDWYYTDGHLYFSELTFYDGSGFDRFYKGQDRIIGSWLRLPPNKIITRS